MGEMERIYLIVISEDEDERISEEKRISIDNQWGYINLGRVWICVLIFDENKKLEDSQKQTLFNTLKNLAKFKEIICINFYHSEGTTIKDLIADESLNSEISDLDLFDIVGRFKEIEEIPFHHDKNDNTYKLIKEILRYAEEKKEDKIIEKIKGEILSKENLQHSNERKLVELLKSIKHKLENNNDINKVKNIVEEKLQDKEMLEFAGEIIFKTLKRILEEGNKKKINEFIDLLEKLIKYIGKYEDTVS